MRALSVLWLYLQVSSWAHTLYRPVSTTPQKSVMTLSVFLRLVIRPQMLRATVTTVSTLMVAVTAVDTHEDLFGALRQSIASADWLTCSSMEPDQLAKHACCCTIQLVPEIFAAFCLPGVPSTAQRAELRVHQRLSLTADPAASEQFFKANRLSPRR